MFDALRHTASQKKQVLYLRRGGGRHRRCRKWIPHQRGTPRTSSAKMAKYGKRKLLCCHRLWLPSRLSHSSVEGEKQSLVGLASMPVVPSWWPCRGPSACEVVSTPCWVFLLSWGKAHTGIYLITYLFIIFFKFWVLIAWHNCLYVPTCLFSSGERQWCVKECRLLSSH